MHQLSDYNYTLPPERIAQQLADPADSCKLLVWDGESIADTIFTDLPTLLEQPHLFVFNNTKVVKARIPLWEGKGEIFYLQSRDEYTFEALVRPGKKFKIGSHIHITDEIVCEVIEITEDGRLLRCNQPILHVLENMGQMPLPPYISYDASKSAAYQPLVAKKDGSVAAPTATLHFTQNILDQLQADDHETVETTLHVGLGTFKQVDVENILDYDIHSERIEVNFVLLDAIAQAKIQGTPILAVGTTVTRTLESLPYLWAELSDEEKVKINIQHKDRRNSQALKYTSTQTPSSQDTHPITHNHNLTAHSLSAETKLFIYPSYQFQIIDKLITNFHLPQSSLLMLVAGFIGYDNMKNIYQHAIDQEYMFYSFGDTMLLEKQKKSPT